MIISIRMKTYEELLRENEDLRRQLAEQARQIAGKECLAPGQAWEGRKENAVDRT
jgi:cell division septum initiation protein DivIVA